MLQESDRGRIYLPAVGTAPFIVNAPDFHWPFEVRALTPQLGAEISGIKLADELSDDVFRAIYQAFLRYQVLLFPSIRVDQS